jgi:membrane-associated phospholipid phosphatase
VRSASNIEEGSGRDWSWWHWFQTNVRDTFATLLRARRPQALWLPQPSVRRVAILAGLAIVAVLATMLVLDAWAIAQARRLPASLVGAFSRFTDFGKSGWFLWPLGLALIALALLDSPRMPAFARHVLAAWAVRLGFVFTAIAIPALFVTIVKRLIGRARPSVEGSDVWTYYPFTWHAAYASFPSGHATTAFSALVAIGALFPSARALMWTYAALIALSRVIVSAHYPSDVVSAAVVGAVGALLVRNWFAARRLGFAVSRDGAVHALPGPGMRRIIKAIACRLARS